ncbi:hypothetical protein EWM62_12505 [Mucilaginibacter terrigena]|uniref:Uncharacterized protein n=1 Tax=Mucilaginibacter terrigena TaxID=2492395 RepID=A0A4Q5LMR0_9SPHI|nr:hypothetical protein [Mucilaginibacter terrigena]RYU90342.1 hypothetical protein EWM62_12505 [Mucilaginibacter terrigena]
MKILLDIQDDKASFILEVLKNFKYVKTKPLTEANSQFLHELKEAVEDVKLIKAGKLKGRPAEELLNEL